MTNTKGSRLDTESVRGRASYLVADSISHLERLTQAGKLLTPVEGFLADTVRDLSELIFISLKTVERDYAAQDAREEARAELSAQPLPWRVPVPSTRELRWTRQDENTWDCMAGDDLWILEQPSPTSAWYLLMPGDDEPYLREINLCRISATDARSYAHRMIREHYAAKGDDA